MCAIEKRSGARHAGDVYEIPCFAMSAPSWPGLSRSWTCVRMNGANGDHGRGVDVSPAPSSTTGQMPVPRQVSVCTRPTCPDAVALFRRVFAPAAPWLCFVSHGSGGESLTRELAAILPAWV